MNEATGFKAKTIHRLLEVDTRAGGFRRDGGKPFDRDLLVVDVTSIVDVMLIRALLAAISDKVALLIVDGVDQLPSVGPGQALADIIASGAVPVVRVTDVLCYAVQSRIDYHRPRDQPARHPRPLPTEGRQRLLFHAG